MSRYRNKKPKNKSNKINLPNGFGQISKLSGARRNPYAVYPPAKRVEELGPDGLMRIRYKRQPALCYVDNWTVAFMILTKYHANDYKVGDEIELTKMYYTKHKTENDIDMLNRFLGAYSINYGSLSKAALKKKTFAEMYNEWYIHKYEREGHKDYSKATIVSTANAFSHCKPLHDRPFEEITYLELQDLIDKINMKGSSKTNVRKMLTQLWDYAIATHQVTLNVSKGIKINDTSMEHGQPFSLQDILNLWEVRYTNETAAILLIMIFSGFRITEYMEMEEINLEEGYFKGGIKTEAGRGRIVPIHSAIRDLVEIQMAKHGKLIPFSSSTLKNRMHDICNVTHIVEDEHTLHDTRHTFSMLGELFITNKDDHKRMMGHAINDITRGVYGHRTLYDLRQSIEEISIVAIKLKVKEQKEAMNKRK